MRTPPTLQKQRQPFLVTETINGAYTVKFTAKQDMSPLEVCATPETVGATAFTIGITDDGAAITGTQDSTTATAATTRTLDLSQSGVRILKGSAVVITITPSGGDSSLDKTLVEFEWAE